MIAAYTARCVDQRSVYFPPFAQGMHRAHGPVGTPMDADGALQPPQLAAQPRQRSSIPASPLLPMHHTSNIVAEATATFSPHLFHAAPTQTRPHNDATNTVSAVRDSVAQPHTQLGTNLLRALHRAMPHLANADPSLLSPEDRQAMSSVAMAFMQGDVSGVTCT